MLRDFTYVDHIVESISRLIHLSPTRDNSVTDYEDNPAISYAPYRLFNIGNSSPVNLMDFIEALQKELDIKTDILFREMQPGDVPRTCADTEALMKLIDFRPGTIIEKGIKEFVSWYKNMYALMEKENA